jgi:hypothetical protein
MYDYNGTVRPVGSPPWLIEANETVEDSKELN